MNARASPALPLGPTTAGFWPRYLRTTRPYLCFVSAAAGVVGLALSPSVTGRPHSS